MRHDPVVVSGPARNRNTRPQSRGIDNSISHTTGHRKSGCGVIGSSRNGIGTEHDPVWYLSKKLARLARLPSELTLCALRSPRACLDNDPATEKHRGDSQIADVQKKGNEVSPRMARDHPVTRFLQFAVTGKVLAVK